MLGYFNIYIYIYIYIYINIYIYVYIFGSALLRNSKKVMMAPRPKLNRGGQASAGKQTF